jgi:hypothetical protein
MRKWLSRKVRWRKWCRLSAFARFMLRTVAKSPDHTMTYQDALGDMGMPLRRQMNGKMARGAGWMHTERRTLERAGFLIYQEAQVTATEKGLSIIDDLKARQQGG